MMSNVSSQPLKVAPPNKVEPSTMDELKVRMAARDAARAREVLLALQSALSTSSFGKIGIK